MKTLWHITHRLPIDHGKVIKYQKCCFFVPPCTYLHWEFICYFCDHSFRYASLRQPHSTSDSSLSTSDISTTSVLSPLSLSITPSLFDTQLKTYLFHKSCSPTIDCFSHSLGLTPRFPDCLRYFLSLFLKLWYSVSFWVHYKYSISYLILGTTYKVWKQLPKIWKSRLLTVKRLLISG